MPEVELRISVTCFAGTPNPAFRRPSLAMEVMVVHGMEIGRTGTRTTIEVEPGAKIQATRSRNWGQGQGTMPKDQDFNSQRHDACKIFNERRGYKKTLNCTQKHICTVKVSFGNMYGAEHTFADRRYVKSRAMQAFHST